MDDIELLRVLAEGWTDNAQASAKRAARLHQYPAVAAASLAEVQIYTDCARALVAALDEIATKTQVRHG